MTTDTRQWVDICALDELVPSSGVAAIVQDVQFAVFYLPHLEPSVYTIGNYDPVGKAQVLSRGIVGDIGGDAVVASPLFKQHFRLTDGQCLEDENMQAGSWPTRVADGRVEIQCG